MIPIGSLVNAAGGVLFVVLGAWLASLKPRRRRTLAFAAFCVAFGLTFTMQNLAAPDLGAAWNQSALVSSGLAAPFAGAAILLVAYDTPHPLDAGRRRLLVLPALVVVLIITAFVTVLLGSGVSSDIEAYFAGLTGGFIVLSAGVQAMLGAQWAAAALMAMRYRHLPKEENAARRELAFMGTAVVVFPAFFTGTLAVDVEPLFRWMGLAGVAVALLVSSLWLQATASAGGKAARNAALAVLGTTLAGVGFSAAAGGFAATDATGVYGVVRTAAVALLAYAILRHHVLGIDVKVRWGISKSTVAAVFIAVFFVASEGAQILLGKENEIVGLAAAGGLVFALSPLQRAADRLAAKAVPVAPGGDASEARMAMEAYRHSLRAAMRDGVLTRREEKHLAELARTLGLDGVQALALREEVEKEAV